MRYSVCLQAKQPVPASVKVKVTQCVGQQGRIPKMKLTCLGISLEINLTHYNKLRLLHAHTAGQVEHKESTFCQHAMALLLRYSSLQGTHYRGGGFQVWRCMCLYTLESCCVTTTAEVHGSSNVPLLAQLVIATTPLLQSRIVVQYKILCLSV